MHANIGPAALFRRILGSPVVRSLSQGIAAMLFAICLYVMSEAPVASFAWSRGWGLPLIQLTGPRAGEIQEPLVYRFYQPVYAIYALPGGEYLRPWKRAWWHYFNHPPSMQRHYGL